MAEIITFINQKGGVGKTSLAMNFGIRLKMAGARVLLVDLDPQCNLTYIMGVDDPPHTIYEVMLRQVSAANAIVQAGECDLIAASPNLSTLNLTLSGSGKEFYLRDALRQIVGLYDFIVIDSPPTLGIRTINVLSMANSVVIPALADVFSIQGVGQLYASIQAVQASSNPDLKITGIVLSRHTDRLLLSRELREMMENAAQQIHTRLFDAVIRESVVVREAQAMRQSVFKYAPRSKQTADYDKLVLEYLHSTGYMKDE